MRHVLLAASLAFLAACSEGLAPSAIAGTHDLVSVGGSTIPWTNDGTRYLSGRLEFEESGSYRYIETQVINVGSEAEVEETVDIVGSWGIQGGWIIMAPAPNYQSRGRLIAGRLTVELCNLSGECGVPTIATRVYAKR